MSVADPTLLAFDTSGPHIAAAVLQHGTVVAQRHEPMKRGQAENLMPILEELLAEAGLAWADLTALGVGIGPGNFTGIRISVAAARGLALGLGIPAVGVSSFELARAAESGTVHLPAPREMAYAQDFTAGAPSGPPRLEPRPAALAEDIPDLPARLATRAAALLASTTPPIPRPAPLYVKAPDAAPARDAPPEIIG
ncbi:tRNA (adenosine(37)-N6)-threonylcarbamoyltransferase complex dimerization subunit type 1 TsaB [Vannielia litorea]|uniref:tRNA (adenosine(37)-N6)-threonylcarbamoyltransferase complex dimerization subunit type 1 TsaB n=1 Tax=Vannielia litorea TaxID=1217970 RepID=UPI001C950B9E|nr:tRNA (adenosine(37)-N6)-threonylcarbamoyltransferase complex dimerization subunit type 1 TsaB [Vannielia litorea]MBY6049870.1 tRNA (adenosine(37)-N6)-threonylcarbamoyltransferase complex dimerization subunit type 1 TsaB [Vannielia litorea]MBY6077284.1 tRNA (adenosine(37)-N6)-threonylcarbamoyltransferase complex dimerization subunit type 1 TsaB [Vannielia litorea]